MKAIVAKRVDSGSADLDEISELARSAGYDVVSTLSQARAADPALQIGEGKASELADLVERENADTVIFDNRLGPYQMYNLGGLLPDGTDVIDRFTLILDIFGQRAKTRKAQLQVELAELRYELPRVEAKTSLAQRDEHPGFMGLGEYDESRERDIKSQISRLTEELEHIEQTEEQRRERRRRSGFDLVALAGYTNAGKSTLLRRLATEVSVEENERTHPDIEPVAESNDELFTTLGTTTRRASVGPREVLVTDTVGFISDLPHWLVESFKSTLDSVYQADLVVLVVDVSEPTGDIHEKLVTCHDTLSERNKAPIITVLNKIDQIDRSELEDKREAIMAFTDDPIAISAKTGDGIDLLRERINDALPRWEDERLALPMTDDTMGLVSWIYDNAHVEDVTYGRDDVIVTFCARQSVIARARSKASELRDVSTPPSASPD